MLAVAISVQAVAKVPNQVPYAKAVKLADLDISHKAPWAKSKKSAHSIFFRYKSDLLKKLQLQTGGKVFVLEVYDHSTGLISGFMWSEVDSLSYIVTGNRVEYQTVFPVSQLTKQALNAWSGAECPNLKIENNDVLPQQFIVQAYGPGKGYKACVVTL